MDISDWWSDNPTWRLKASNMTIDKTVLNRTSNTNLVFYPSLSFWHESTPSILALSAISNIVITVSADSLIDVDRREHTSSDDGWFDVRISIPDGFFNYSYIDVVLKKDYGNFTAKTIDLKSDFPPPESMEVKLDPAVVMSLNRESLYGSAQFQPIGRSWYSEGYSQPARVPAATAMSRVDKVEVQAAMYSNIEILKG